MRKIGIITGTIFFVLIVASTYSQAIGPPSKHVQGMGEIKHYDPSDNYIGIVHFSLDILEVRPEIPTGKKILDSHALLVVDGVIYQNG